MSNEQSDALGNSGKAVPVTMFHGLQQAAAVTSTPVSASVSASESKIDSVSGPMFKCEHNGVLFPSVADDEFRTKVSRTKDGLVFWIESKGSKQQWQKTVANIAECGPAGMPEEAILALLKRAFDLKLLDSVDEESINSDEPLIDLNLAGEDVLLTLTLSVCNGAWKPEYTVTLLPMAMAKIDVLEAKLRDAHDEIKHLQDLRGLIPAMMKQRSKGNYRNGSGELVVCWDAPDGVMPPEYFTMSDDKTTVTVLKQGLYEVTVRLASTGQGNLNLMLNSVCVATTKMCRSLHEYFTFKPDDQISIRIGDGFEADPLQNCFTILRIHDEIKT